MPARLNLPIALGVAAAAVLCLAAAIPVVYPGSGGAASAEGSAAVPPGAERAAKTPRRAVLRLRNTRFGKVIHEKKSGLVAYLFTRDKRRKSKCYGACAKGWPPIKTRKRPRAGKGLKQRHVGMIKRRNGSRMLTYKGRPLYFYVHDSPGVILCNDVREYGGDWFVVRKNGRPPRS
jgi:predicted lipoprotein with Yx(FWY)xxD motif